MMTDGRSKQHNVHSSGLCCFGRPPVITARFAGRSHACSLLRSVFVRPVSPFLIRVLRDLRYQWCRICPRWLRCALQFLIDRQWFSPKHEEKQRALGLQISRGMLLDDRALNDVTSRILASAIEVHRELGAGLFEGVYHPCLQFELTARGLHFAAEQSVPVIYKSIRLPAAYRVDLIVEDLVVVEVKAIDALAPIHTAQLLTYLRLTERPAGLLINFNVPKLMDGVKRLINPRAQRFSERS